MRTATAVIRRARPEDLDGALGVWYATELVDQRDLPPLTVSGEVLRHDVETGDLFVADQDGAVVGFASSFARDGVRFLSNLFVRPDAQGAGLGGLLLQAAMPSEGGEVRCTMSSGDVRALSLYLRHGMKPRWPHLLLHADAGPIDLPADPSEVRVVPADPNDPELLSWDAELSGRRRPQDLAHLVADLGARAVWFERTGRRVGYGFVQERSPLSLRDPQRVTVGPVGATDGGDAMACVLEAVRLAAGRSRSVGISVPGPHPAVPALLRAGFRIDDVELFMASTEFVDPARYVASGSEVF